MSAFRFTSRAWPIAIGGGLATTLLLALNGACSSEAPPPTATTMAPASAAAEEPTARATRLPYEFVDATAGSGLDAFHQVNGEPEKLLVVESFGAGVALFDADGDGDLDAYLANGSYLERELAEEEKPRDALFLNDGSGHFTDGTAAAGLGSTGWTTGVRTVDLEGDGDLDLYLTAYGPNVLYENQGDGTFVDVTERAGVGDPRWSTGACFLDFDRDGDLDLYVANYLVFDEERELTERRYGSMIQRTSAQESEKFGEIQVMFGPRGLDPDLDCFYVNEGDGTFRDASEELGIEAEAGFGFQCIAFDADRDGWVDVYVANDVIDNLMWHNEEGRGFRDLAMQTGTSASMSGQPQGGMGVAIGDYDADLWPDIYVTNYVDDYSTMYNGVANGFFVDKTRRTRLAEPTMKLVGWGCGFEDFDSDGDLEVYAVNGHVYPQVDGLELGTSYKQLNYLYEFDGQRFVAPEGEGGPGFALLQATRGAAVGDVDGDGDLDLLFGNLDDTPTLLRNDGPNGNWVKVLVHGRGGNREAVGARAVGRVGATQQLRLVASAGSFLSSSDPRLHFGLGEADELTSLEITWPEGEVETFEHLAAGRTWIVERGAEGEASTLRARE